MGATVKLSLIDMIGIFDFAIKSIGIAVIILHRSNIVAPASD